jgi:zinc protease
MTVATAGGIPSFTDMVNLIESRFNAWRSAASRPDPIAPEAAPDASRTASTSIAGKSQADIAVGFPTVARTAPDYYAVETANLILGRLGLMGRLGKNVRDEQGLAYYVFSVIEAGKQGSVWMSRAGVDPANTRRALDGIVAEVRRLREEAVSDEELEDAKSFLTGSLPLALEMNEGIVNLLQSIEYYGLGLDYLDRYPAIISALTAKDLHAAARQHLDDQRLVVGIAGPPEN